MNIKKEDLKKALEIVKPGLANKEIIDQSTSFAFIDGCVVTYNDEISIRHPINIDLTGAIKATELYSLLAKIKKDDIELEVVENELQVTSGKLKASFTLIEKITLPLDDIPEGEEWYELPETFPTHLNKAILACSTDFSRPILTCVHVTENGYVESGDGYRIYRGDCGEDIAAEFLLPATSAAQASKMNPVEFHVAEGWIHFRNEEDTVLSCRIFEDKFPNIDKWLKIEEGVELTFPKTLVDVIDRASVFSKRDNWLDETIDITIAENKITVQASSDTGKFEETLNMKWAGDPIGILIAPALMRSIIKQTQTAIYNPGSLKFEGDDWEYLSMLKLKAQE